MRYLVDTKSISIGSHEHRECPEIQIFRVQQLLIDIRQIAAPLKLARISSSRRIKTDYSFAVELNIPRRLCWREKFADVEVTLEMQPKYYSSARTKKCVVGMQARTLPPRIQTIRRPIRPPWDYMSIRKASSAES